MPSAGPLSVEVPVLGSLQASALALTALGCVLMFVVRWNALRTLGVCALAGVALYLFSTAL